MMRAGVGARIVVCGHRAGCLTENVKLFRSVRRAEGRPVSFVGRRVAARPSFFPGRMP